MKETVPTIITGGIAVDERGELMYNNDIDLTDVRRFYIVRNHTKGFVRAWHGHMVEGKYVTVLQGAAVVGVVRLVLDKSFASIDERLNKPFIGKEPAHRFVLSAKNPKTLWIPPGYANGWMGLTDDTVVMYMSTHAYGDVCLDDDFRFPWFEANGLEFWEIKNG